MTNFGVRRHFVVVAACFCGALALAAGTEASGQQTCAPEGGTEMQDAAPYVMPPPTTCDPSNYISTPDSATGPTTPATNMFSFPVPAEGGAPPMVAGNVYTMLGIQDPMATTFSYSDVKPPYADAAGCKAFADQGHPALHSCLCDKCFTQMQECDALVGCKVIAKCAWDSGCDPSAGLTSPTSCYPLAGGGCTAPINQYGTGSVSTSIAQQLGLCGRTNGCPNQ